MLRAIISSFFVVISFSVFSQAPDLTEYQRPDEQQLEKIRSDVAEEVKEAKSLLENETFRLEQKYHKQAATSFRNKTAPLKVVMPDFSFSRERQQNALKNILDGPQREQQQNYYKQRDKPLVLVSMSIPEQELLTLLEDVSKIGGQIVFRGMIDNDILKTAQTFKSLGVDEEQMASVTLDPTLFTRFNVTQVPTFIMPLDEIEQCVPGNCEVPEHVIATGSVTLQYFLEAIVRNLDDERKVESAEKWLAQLEQKND